MATAILIVNYRAYDELRRCLESVARFVGPDDRIVVVDYESDDRALGRALDLPVEILAIPRPDNLGFAAGGGGPPGGSRRPRGCVGGPVGGVEGLFFLRGGAAVSGRAAGGAGFGGVSRPRAGGRRAGGAAPRHDRATAIRAFHASAFRL